MGGETVSLFTAELIAGGTPVLLEKNSQTGCLGSVFAGTYRAAKWSSCHLPETARFANPLKRHRGQ